MWKSNNDSVCLDFLFHLRRKHQTHRSALGSSTLSSEDEDGFYDTNITSLLNESHLQTSNCWRKITEVFFLLLFNLWDFGREMSSGLLEGLACMKSSVCHALQICLAVVLGFIFSAAVRQRQVVRIIRMHFFSFQLWSWLLQYCHVSSVLKPFVFSSVMRRWLHFYTWIMFSKRLFAVFLCTK